MERQTSLSLGREVIANATDEVDRISKLPNDVLVKILSKLPNTEEVMRTSVLSKRWMNVWKDIPYLFFDMRKIININGVVLPRLLERGATFISKVINDHVGHLETSVIFHYSHQCEDGTLNSWVQSLTSEKHTKNLILANFLGRLEPNLETNELNLPPNTFQDLKIVSISQYILKDALAFNDCRNIKRLDLFDIFSEVDVFNKVLSSCPTLEVLYLQIFFKNPSGHFIIDHKKLRLVLMSCNEIDKIKISAPRLDILSISYALCERDNVVLEVPRLPFKKNYWVNGSIFPHTSYNISCPSEENAEDRSDDLFVGMNPNSVRRYASLSVSLDLKNPREVEILREALCAWEEVKMIELEIFFKNNKPLVKDGESSSGEAENNLWTTIAKPFPSAFFRVDIVWMYNFSGSSEEEFALASLFVKQKTVLKKMMINTSAFPREKRLKIEEAVAKLKILAQGNEELSIECF